MTTASISLQDLQRRLYVKAKAEKNWRFWGMYVHVSKLETLRAAYAMTKQANGAPGIDGDREAYFDSVRQPQCIATAELDSIRWRCCPDSYLSLNGATATKG